MEIDALHPIFLSAAYQKDSVAFQLIESIKLAPSLLVSDGENWIIGGVHVDYPYWIWTREGIDAKIVESLCTYVLQQFGGKNFYFVAKPEIADKLVDPFLQDGFTQRRIRMQSYKICTPIVYKSNIPVSRPTIADIEGVARCLAGFERDTFGCEVQVDDFMQNAEKKIGNPHFFVVKQDGQVVATAQSSRETQYYISINQVYTSPSYRNRGFASALVAHLGRLIQEKEKIPTLYADVTNPASNHAYQKVGFIGCGCVDDVKIIKNR